jgi:hypothetical protein
MISYAGIGSRRITEQEEQLIIKISGKLADSGMVVYSGNADGADISFQKGSGGKCVLMLPWTKFNTKKYDVMNSLARFSLGKSPDGLVAIDKYHPSPASLTFGGRSMMARNFHQIMGYDVYPKVSFVVCCSDRDENKNVIGGTGQACRIAIDNGIPVFNIRDENWNVPFVTFLNGIK